MEGDAYSEALFPEKVLTTQHAGTTEARNVLSESRTACCHDTVHHVSHLSSEDGPNLAHFSRGSAAA